MEEVLEMGKIMTRVKVENYADIVTGDNVRSIDVEAMVGTGATTLCLPGKMIHELGLATAGIK